MLFICSHFALYNISSVSFISSILIYSSTFVLRKKRVSIDVLIKHHMFIDIYYHVQIKYENNFHCVPGYVALTNDITACSAITYLRNE